MFFNLISDQLIIFTSNDRIVTKLAENKAAQVLHQVDERRAAEAEERGRQVGVELGQGPAGGVPEPDEGAALRQVLPAEARQGQEERELLERGRAARAFAGGERSADPDAVQNPI